MSAMEARSILRLAHWVCVGVLTAFAAQAAPEVQVFTRQDCGPCRQQLRVLTTLGLKPVARDIDRDPAAREAFAARLAALGLADSEERLPLVTVDRVTLPDDPALPTVLKHLPTPPPRWAPPGGVARIQKFGGAACPAAEATLHAAGLHWESADPSEPAVAERMWVQLRLLGHPPRQGTSLPVWLVGARILQGCPDAGALAHALPQPAIVAWARAVRDQAPEAFATRTIRVLATLRDRPRLGLKRLLVAPGLLDASAPLSGQLQLASRRRPVRPRPWGTLEGPVVRIPDPWTPGDAAAALLDDPAAWAAGPMLASARLVDLAGVPTLEVQWAPDPAEGSKPE